MNVLKNLRGVTCDSREVEPGFAFVAIQGLMRDGHDFIEDALARGASCIFTERTVQLNSNVPVHKVKDGRIALAELAAVINHHPSKYLKTIGVTGTNGKTTTTFLIHHLFNQNKIGCGLIGTVDIDTGFQKLKAQLTTPDSVKLQGYLHEMVDKGLKAVAMEVSSHGIELKRTYGVEFDLAIFTNITNDHFDFHKNFESYLESKKSLFKQLSSDAVALVNIDDSYSSYIMSEIQAQNITFGISTNAMIRAENIRNENINTYYDLIIKNPIETKFARLDPMRIPLRITMLGKHNMYNSLAACSACLLMGLAPDQIQHVSTFPGVWRRFQIIHNHEFTIIDDCAHNPASYEAVFETIQNLNYKNLYIINAIRGNRGVKINRDNALTIALWVKKLAHTHLMITNCEEVVKKNDLVSVEEEKVFLQTLQDENIEFEHSAILQNLFQKVLSMVRPGDLILLLGAHAMDHAGELLIQKIN